MSPVMESKYEFYHTALSAVDACIVLYYSDDSRMTQGRESSMEEHLIKEIRRRLKRTPASQRVAEIKEFIGRSEAHRKLVEKTFPDLYREATSRRTSEVSSSAPNHRVELGAKPR